MEAVCGPVKRGIPSDVKAVLRGEGVGREQGPTVSPVLAEVHSGLVPPFPLPSALLPSRADIDPVEGIRLSSAVLSPFGPQQCTSGA